MYKSLNTDQNIQDVAIALAFRRFAKVIGCGSIDSPSFHFGVTIESEPIDCNFFGLKRFPVLDTFYGGASLEKASDVSSPLEFVAMFGRLIRRMDEVRQAGTNWFEFWTISFKEDEQIRKHHLELRISLFTAVVNYYELDIEVTSSNIDNLPFVQLISLMLFHKDDHTLIPEYAHLASDIFVNLSENNTEVIESTIKFTFGRMLITVPLEYVETTVKMDIHRQLSEYRGTINPAVLDTVNLINSSENKTAFFKLAVSQ